MKRSYSPKHHVVIFLGVPKEFSIKKIIIIKKEKKKKKTEIILGTWH